MLLEPSEEQVLLRDTVSRFLADRTDAASIGAGPMPSADWRGIAELGVLAFLLEGAADDTMIVSEALGRALAITPLGEGVIGAGDLIARHGDPATIERFVAPLLTGETILALAKGSVREGGHGVSGRFEFVRWAPQAAAIVVLAEDAAHVVATDADGVAMTPRRLADGTVAATVTLSEVPTTAIPLPPGAADTALAMIDLVHAAEMIGVMALLCALTAEFVTTRRQFGVEIGSFQAVQHKRARMFVALEQARSLTIKAAAIGRDDPAFVRAALSAKAYAADAAQRLAEDAVQLHGGIGVTDELAVGRGLRRVMVLARLFGGAGQARAKLAA
jgi:alkylation response protein AidB-like acyl-CoA dehydrogenase